MVALGAMMMVLTPMAPRLHEFMPCATVEPVAPVWNLPIFIVDGVAIMAFARVGLGWGVQRPMGVVSWWGRCCELSCPIVGRLAIPFKRLRPGNVKGMNTLNDSLSQIYCWLLDCSRDRARSFAFQLIRMCWFKCEQPSEIIKICPYLFSSLGYVIKY